MGICHPLPLIALAACLAFPAVAKAEPAIDLTIKDHRFTPAEIHVPAGKPVTLNVKNEVPSCARIISSPCDRPENYR